MIRKVIYSIVTAILLTFSSRADTVVVTQDDPNPGDTTTITTITTGNPVTTDNLLSQDWTDGSWVGTMFPDSSDINESIYLTGKDGKYAESTIQSEGILTEAEIQQGLTSTLSADIRWWNQWESTVLMTQTATDSNGTTIQNILLEDTTNHNYEFNTYTNTLIIAPDTESTHGSLTARFTFDVDDAAGNWNGGHSGVDIIEPDLKLNYNALTQTTVTTIEFCWQKTPPTCPGQDEIAEVETIINTFEDDLDDLYLDDIYLYEEDTFLPETIDFEYSFNTEYFEEEEFELEDDYLAFDDFFFEEEYFEDDYYEDFELEEYVPEDMAFEEIEYFDEIPETFAALAPTEEVFFEEPEYFEEEYVEVFTNDTFIDEVEEMFEDIPVEDIEMTEEYFEEKFEEYFEEQPEIVEEFEEEYIVEEEAMEEEPEVEVAMAEEETMEEPNEVEGQPSSESIVADEPEETTDVAEQEEPLDETTPEEGSSEGDVGSGETVEDVQTVEEKPKVALDIKVAAIEKAIQSKISNEMQRVSVTLDVVNEIISREMIATQPDLSVYFDLNSALFDNRQLPGGNPDFFTMQASLDSYSKTIYNTQANLAGTDPVVQYQIKLNEARSVTDAAYIKLKGLMDARSNK